MEVEYSTALYVCRLHSKITMQRATNLSRATNGAWRRLQLLSFVLQRVPVAGQKLGTQALVVLSTPCLHELLSALVVKW